MKYEEAAQIYKLMLSMCEAGPNGVDATPATGKSSASEWTVLRRAKGKVPNWVKALTGCDTKQEVLRKYSHGFKFTKGMTLPQEVASEN